MGDAEIRFSAPPGSYSPADNGVALDIKAGCRQRFYIARGCRRIGPGGGVAPPVILGVGAPGVIAWRKCRCASLGRGVPFLYYWAVSKIWMLGPDVGHGKNVDC